ncbi:MAG: N-6 DNA methylase [Bacteroidota bacterium]
MQNLLCHVAQLLASDKVQTVGIPMAEDLLFIPSTASQEQDVRRWLIEQDWLLAIISFPNQAFSTTAPYVWIITNQKRPQRIGKIQLIHGKGIAESGNQEAARQPSPITEKQLRAISRRYTRFKEGAYSKIFEKEAFGYQRITIERPLRLTFQASAFRIARLKAQPAFLQAPAQQKPLLKVLNQFSETSVYAHREIFLSVLRSMCQAEGLSLEPFLEAAVLAALGKKDATAAICRDAQGQVEPDPELRHYENVPLQESVAAYFEREIRPYFPAAWVDLTQTRIGYRINFSRPFPRSSPPLSPEKLLQQLFSH